MGKITRYSNWCELDQLDGVTLQNGEILSVEWPDGSKSVVTIEVDNTPGTYSDHGRESPMPKSIAYTPLTYRGVKSLVPLIGCLAVRRKPPV